MSFPEAMGEAVDAGAEGGRIRTFTRGCASRALPLYCWYVCWKKHESVVVEGGNAWQLKASGVQGNGGLPAGGQ